MAKAPCKDCPDRVYPECLKSCEKYIAFKEDWAKRNAAVKAAKQKSYDIISGIPKSTRRGKRR